jgi:hypothetical protein
MPAALVGLGVALLLATRLRHPIAGLGNADIAGILYQADLIVDGGVPYRDAADMKPPGTFFVFAAIFAAFGRGFAAVQWSYVAWCLLAAPAIWLAARELYGRDEAGRAPAAVAVLLYLGVLGGFDLNYSAWMTTAYAWAFACALAGVRRGRWAWHLAAGFAAALAFALKGQAVVLAPTFAGLWWWGRRRGEPGATLAAWPLWLVGAGLGLAPLLLWFHARGALPEALAGLVPLAAAREYAARVQPEHGWLLGLWKVPWQHLRVFPLHSLLAASALLGWRWARRRGLPTPPVAPQALLWGLSVVGCGLGGLRYYVHYLPQYLPALALLGAHPAVRPWWAAREPDRPRATWLRRGLMLACGVAAAGWLVAIPLGKANLADFRGSRNARRAGDYIRARTRPDETVQVWGWAAWSTYYFADRRAPSPVFKVLGQVTEYNENSLLSRSRTADFKPGPHADALLAAFRTAPPAFFVQATPFFPGVEEDPLEQFTALREIVARDYRLVKRFGRLKVFERRGHAGPKGGKRRGEAPAKRALRERKRS